MPSHSLLPLLLLVLSLLCGSSSSPTSLKGCCFPRFGPFSFSPLSLSKGIHPYSFVLHFLAKVTQVNNLLFFLMSFKAEFLLCRESALSGCLASARHTTYPKLASPPPPTSQPCHCLLLPFFRLSPWTTTVLQTLLWLEPQFSVPCPYLFKYRSAHDPCP